MTYELRNPEVFTSEELAELEALKVDGENLVSIGEISNLWLGEQTQFVSRYFHGKMEEYPLMVEGLRFSGDLRNHHSWKLHKEDVQEFIIRVRRYRWSRSQPCR